jgi:Domain of unknown function (DUF1992)
MTPPRPGPDRPLIRRDADGTERTAPSWETLTERLIREAQESGAFDELPHRGRSLPSDDDAHAGEMAMSYRVAPPWVEAHKEARRLEAEVERLLAHTGRRTELGRGRAREQLTELVREHDKAVERLAVLAPTHRQHRRRLDLPALLHRLDDHPAAGRRAT